MRKDLFLGFLGLWIALVPFLPLSCGSTEDAVFIVSGVLVAILAFFSLRKFSSVP